MIEEQVSARLNHGVRKQHFGIVSPPVSGHLHPFGALGRNLIALGHRVTVFQVPDLQHKIASEGLEFVAVGEMDHPPGSLPASLQQLAQLGGWNALRFTIRAVAKTTEMMCRDLPAAAQKSGVTALLVDQMEPCGGAVAEHLGLPFITICNALPLNRENGVPPPFTPWPYQAHAAAVLRNRVGYAVGERIMRPVTKIVSRYRKAWGLKPLQDADQSFSPLAQISQMPREFDFPRRQLPDTFHYVGPMRAAHDSPVSFPWERLDGRPLVYASLGTLQNQRLGLFRDFAEACRQLNLQLVMTHGGGLTADATAELPGKPIVVSYAPQLDVLKHAALTLTHAGLNTVLDSLTCGVPVIAVPITYEQPAIASRVRWADVGEVLPLRQVNVSRLINMMAGVLGDSQIKGRLSHLAARIAASGGASRAAAEIQRIVTT